MSEIIERVGRILFRQARGQSCPPFSNNWTDYEEDAREIVAAMRQPTDEQAYAGAKALAMEMQAPSATLMAIGYVAMIDETLK